MLRKLWSFLGGDVLLGLFFPRAGVDPNAPPQPPVEPTPDPSPAPPAPGADDHGALDHAAQLEAANQRYRDLEARLEQEAQRRAEALVSEVFPSFEPTPPAAPAPRHRAAEPSPDAGFDPPPDPPAEPDRLDMIERQLQDVQIQDAVRDLEGQLDTLEQHYPYMDRVRILAQIAQAGDRPVNIPKLAEISHNTNLVRLDRYYQDRRARETNTPPSPAPIPRGSAGAPVAPTKITGANAAQVLEEKLRASGFGSG